MLNIKKWIMNIYLYILYNMNILIYILYEKQLKINNDQYIYQYISIYALSIQH